MFKSMHEELAFYIENSPLYYFPINSIGVGSV